MTEPASKKQRTTPEYELIYWPGIPGRGEYVRLVFEASGTPYADVAREKKGGVSTVTSACSSDNIGDSAGNPPIFAPPALRVVGALPDGSDLVFHQTPTILSYLGPRTGLVPDDEAGRLYVSQITATALDLGNEAHDTHHPVAVMAYYEEQKDESLRKAEDFRKSRIPKFFSYFERILQGNQEWGNGQGKYLVGDKLTYADTTVWQVVDGLHHAFPKEIEAREGDFPLLLGKFYPSFKEEKRIKEYLGTERRQKYGNGIFRRYPELDRK